MIAIVMVIIYNSYTYGLCATVDNGSSICQVKTTFWIDGDRSLIHLTLCLSLHRHDRSEILGLLHHISPYMIYDQHMTTLCLNVWTYLVYHACIVVGCWMLVNADRVCIQIRPFLNINYDYEGNITICTRPKVIYHFQCQMKADVNVKLVGT